MTIKHDGETIVDRDVQPGAVVAQLVDRQGGQPRSTCAASRGRRRRCKSLVAARLAAGGRARPLDAEPEGARRRRATRRRSATSSGRPTKVGIVVDDPGPAGRRRRLEDRHRREDGAVRQRRCARACKASYKLDPARWCSLADEVVRDYAHWSGQAPSKLDVQAAMYSMQGDAPHRAGDDDEPRGVARRDRQGPLRGPEAADGDRPHGQDGDLLRVREGAVRDGAVLGTGGRRAALTTLRAPAARARRGGSRACAAHAPAARVSWRGARVAPRSAPRVAGVARLARRSAGAGRRGRSARTGASSSRSGTRTGTSSARSCSTSSRASTRASRASSSRPCTRATTSSRSRSCAPRSPRGPRRRSRTSSSRSCPYLARAGVLEPLDGYEGAATLAFVPALDQRGSFAATRRRRREPLFGIPFNRSTPIVVRQRPPARAGARRRCPRTWDELAPTAARGSPGGAPTATSAGGSRSPSRGGTGSRWSARRAGRVVEPDGRVSLGGAAGEEALRFWQRLVAGRPRDAPAARARLPGVAVDQRELPARARRHDVEQHRVRALPREHTRASPSSPRRCPRRVRASVPTGGTMFVLLRAAPDEEKRAAWEFVRWMCEHEQTIAWSTRTGYMPVTRPAVERLTESGWYAQPPERSRRLRPARRRRPLAVGAGPLSRRARRRRAAPRGGRAHRARRRRGDGRGARRGDEARMTPRSRWHPWAMLGADAGAARRLLRRPHRRRGLREPLLVGPADAPALRRRRELPRASPRTASSCASPCGRSPTARSSSPGRCRSVSRWRSSSTARGASSRFVRASVFSAYVVSWVAVALLWMGLFDRGGTARCSAIRAGRCRRSRSWASGSSPGTR